MGVHRFDEVTWHTHLRLAGPGARAHGCVRLEGVADPSRGTRVAIGIPLVAAAATIFWVPGPGRRSTRPSRSPLRCSSWLQRPSGSSFSSARAAGTRPRLPSSFSPRSSAGRSSVSSPASRRRSFAPRPCGADARRGWGGCAAGPRCRHRRAPRSSTGGNKTAAAAAAMVAAVAVNSGGRLLIMLERRTRPLLAALAPRGAGRPPRDRSRRPAALGAPDRRRARAHRSSSRRWRRFSPSLLLAQRSRGHDRSRARRRAGECAA